MLPPFVILYLCYMLCCHAKLILLFKNCLVISIYTDYWIIYWFRRREGRGVSNLPLSEHLRINIIDKFLFHCYVKLLSDGMCMAFSVNKTFPLGQFSLSFLGFILKFIHILMTLDRISVEQRGERKQLRYCSCLPVTFLQIQISNIQTDYLTHDGTLMLSIMM